MYENADDVDNPNKLTMLTVTKTPDAMLYFDPSGTDGTPLSLCGDGDVCDFDDKEFLYFGYWRRDPEAAASAYTLDSIGVFAYVDGTTKVGDATPSVDHGPQHMMERQSACMWRKARRPARTSPTGRGNLPLMST